MCTVEKILIKGIRSFSPDNEYVIEFYKPLTIIVGSNGAGKTTIIECLRNATTGELPPNTRQGQGFVHDPKVAGESEVKAQIKLSFRTATGQPIYVTRSFQLTQKKTALQFKSLDAVLTCRNRLTGQRESVTYRCADLDRMVPTLMGVSKAVLENVIFVHQEESNWPLAEGKVLKEKFDDIFAATKYTKALEALRKLRSEKAQSLKEGRLTLETIKQVRDMASHHTRERDAARGRVTEAQQQLAGFEEKVKDLDSQRSSLSSRLAEVEALARQLSGRRGQLEQLRSMNREREERFRAAGRADFEESDEELRRHLAAAEAGAEQQAARVRQLEGAVAGGRRDKAAAEEAYQREVVRHGQLVGEAATHSANMAARDAAIRDTAAALGLQPPQEGEQEGGMEEEEEAAGGGRRGGWSVAAADAFCFGSVGEVVRRREARLQELRAEARSTESRLSAAVDAASSQLARAQEGLRLKRQQLEENRAAISSCGAQIQSSQVTEVGARALREEAERAEEAYRRKQSEESCSPLPRQLDAARAEVEGRGRRISELRAERQRAAAAAEGGAALRMKRTDLEAKEEQLRNVLSARRLDLSRALGLPPGAPLPPAGPGPGGLRAACEALLGSLRGQEAERLAAAQQANREAEAAKSAATSAAQAVSRCRGDLERLRGELRGGMAAALGDPRVGEEDYNNRVTAVQKAEDKRRSRLGKAHAMQTLFGSYREMVVGGHDCPLCRRGFSEEERRACVEYIDQDMRDLPSSIADCQSSLAQLQRQLDALRGLQPAWVRLGDLAGRLPGLEREAQAARQAEEEAAERAEASQADYAEVQERVRELGRLHAEVVWPLDRLGAEVEGLRREVAHLEVAAGLSSSSSSSSAAPPRSVGEVDAELEAEEAGRQAAEAARDAALQRMNRLRDEVLAAQRVAMSAQQRALEAAAAVHKVQELQNKIRELESASVVLEGEVAAAAALLAPLEAEREAAGRGREEARQRAAAEVAVAEEQLRDAQLRQSQLSALVRQVSEYEGAGRGRALAAAGEAVAAARGRVEAAGRQLAEWERELEEIRQQLVEDAALRRDVADVLELRAGRAAEEAAERELAEGAEQLARVGDPGALQRQLSALGEQRDALRSRQDVLRGQQQAAQQAAQRAQGELNDAKYRDIHKRYASQQVAVKTTELALSDLDKYYKALEKALLVFHSSKMADINKVVKELWQKTYRGQDIDYIQIKADTEGAGTRSYNYRVVMYSGSAELEMRGRCSAGQKVLACLIIRLALAETFCLNCGILALDEPTTNLDAENSASLARALKSLMESRAGQENFQLIVITHDEAFATLIGSREVADSLWRVTKDPATQHTLVTPEALRD